MIGRSTGHARARMGMQEDCSFSSPANHNVRAGHLRGRWAPRTSSSGRRRGCQTLGVYIFLSSANRMGKGEINLEHFYIYKCLKDFFFTSLYLQACFFSYTRALQTLYFFFDTNSDQHTECARSSRCRNHPRSVAKHASSGWQKLKVPTLSQIQHPRDGPRLGLRAQVALRSACHSKCLWSPQRRRKKAKWVRKDLEFGDKNKHIFDRLYCQIT